MSKTPRRKPPSAAPSPAQLAAVRRAAQSGDVSQARTRLAALRKSFPAFKPLLGLAWEVEDLGDAPMLACARAWEWQHAAPNSRAAVEALCMSAEEAGLGAVHARALHRLRTIDGEEVPPPADVIDAPLGPLTFEQAEAIDLSRMHLADGNAAAAAAVLQGVNHPSARNNLALALFTLGDLAQAREVIEANWQADPDNLFALERLVRWRCWAEGMDRCLGFASTLSLAVPRRVEDAIARVSALRFLGEEEAAGNAWHDAAEAPYWDAASDEQDEMFDDLHDPDAELAGMDTLWFPSSWIEAMAALSRESRQQGALAVEQRWNARLDACDAHADYLARAVELGSAAVRLLALEVLKRRAQLADTAARAALQQLLRRPGGPDSRRMDLLNWLADEGLQSRDEPVEVWIAGSLRLMRSYGIHITGEPRPSPFPPAGTALNERMHKAIRHRSLNEALALAQQLHRMHPDQPSALSDMAAIKKGLGHPHGEVTELYRQAYALAPDYLFARCGLARCLADEGRLDEARALLDGLLERKEWHYSEYRGFLLTQLALARASDEDEAVQALEASLLELEQNFAD